MIFAGAQSQLDQCAGIRNGLALPAVVGLKAAHGGFAVGVPCAGRFSGEVVLADQSFLDGLRPVRSNNLLSAYS